MVNHNFLNLGGNRIIGAKCIRPNDNPHFQKSSLLYKGVSSIPEISENIRVSVCVNLN